jgi:membrane-bound lytic murein transglycosylase
MDLTRTHNRVSLNTITKGGGTMRKWQILMGGAALSVMVLSGCTAKLSATDREMLNKAAQSGQMAADYAQKAQASAGMASDAAMRADGAAQRAEDAAARAEQSAADAAASAKKAERAFEMCQKK